MLTSDSYFTNAKKPEKSCQDYALNNDMIEFPYAIVCDGCSSSRHTDIGARILAHLSVDIIDSISLPDNFHDLYEDIKKKIVSKAKIFPLLLSIPEECLDSTLLISVIVENHIHSFMYGDGYIISNNEYGIPNITKVEFMGNAPYYLSYEIYPEKKLLYKEFAQDEKTKTIYSKYINSSETKVDHDFMVGDCKRIDDISTILIATDGIGSFVNFKTGERISDTEIIKELLSIKSKNGEFIKRRVKRMLQNLAEKDIYNTDDIAIAGFINHD